MESNFRSDMLEEQGDSYDICIEQIRRKYGSNYLIVQKSEVPSQGLFAMFKPPKYVVRYVLQPASVKRAKALSKMPSDFKSEQKKILEETNPVSGVQMNLLLNEMQALRREVEQNQMMLHSEDHQNLQKVENLLEKNEFTASYIRKLTDNLRKEFSLGDLDDFKVIEKATVDYIGDTVAVADIKTRSRPEIIVLVGPTGVGKTTTVAKLAALQVLSSEKSMPQKQVRIITIDHYRLGAEEQLRKYGDIMSIPVSMAKDESELKNLLDMYKSGVDVILIDTAGYSPRDYENIGKMRKILDVHGVGVKIYLTVSASTKASDLREIMRQYEIFGYSSLIITKLDETDNIGNVVSVLAEKDKSVAYYTTGQRVPRDIEKADAVGLLKRLTDFTIDREHIDSKFTVVD